MKVKVKHRHIEIEVSDPEIHDTKTLLYHNEKYAIELLTQMINKVKELLDKENENIK